MPPSRASRWRKARHLIACEGIGGIVEELGARLRHRLHDPQGNVPYHEFRTMDWDRRRGVRTGGIVEVQDFEPGISNREHAEPHIPTDLWSFRAMMGDLLDLGVRPADFTLVDIGSGKGRVIFMGAEMGFRKVIGVEFDPRLARCAAENLGNYRGKRGEAITVHHGDAAEFPIPPGPLVTFLFNPFRGPVLETLAENLRRSFAEDPREIYVSYLFPHPDAPFGRDASFERVATGPRREIYRLAGRGS